MSRTIWNHTGYSSGVRRNTNARHGILRVGRIGKKSVAPRTVSAVPIVLHFLYAVLEETQRLERNEI